MQKKHILSILFSALLLSFIPSVNALTLDEVSLLVVDKNAGELSKLSLTAQATLSKPADELKLKLGVISLGDNAAEALEDNNTKMQAVIEELKAAGLSQNEYETGNFSINPTYTPYPTNPPENWKQTINGYEVINSINIKTNQLDSVGKFIDTASKAGANSIDNIAFTLHDPRAHWKEAITAAANNALEDATAIAAAANVRLVRVISLNLDNTNVSYAKVNSKFVSEAMVGGSMPTIEAGDVKITASISITYEIAPL